MLRLTVIYKVLLLVAAATLASSCSSTDWFNEPVATPMEPDSVAINPMSHYIVLVGDIQTYTMHPDDYMSYFKESMDWVRVQKSFFNNIDAVLQVGDLTDGNDDWQWANALLAIKDVAGEVPFIAVTGNHDYDWLNDGSEQTLHIPSRESTLFDLFPIPVHRSMKMIDTYTVGSRRNAIYSLMIGARVAHVLALEFAPPPEVVDWAAAHVASNTGIDCYLLTHEWLTGRGNLVDSKTSYAIKHFGSEKVASTPAMIWERLVAPYDNVIAVVCGHNGFVASRFTPNRAGRHVPQILFNLQYRDNGGDSMLQLWEFDSRSDSVYTTVYNTHTRIHCPDSAAVISFSRARAIAPGQ